MNPNPFQLYNAKVFDIGVSRQTLARLHALCGKHQKIALVGWSDYAKHLINVIGDRISCIVDESPEAAGLSFRGKPVVTLAEATECDAFVQTRYELLVDTARALADRDLFYKVPYLYAEDYEGRSTTHLNPIEHDQLYRSIKAAGTPPPTMMNDDRVLLLTETLRTALRLPGAVVEIGAWQGGSAWYLCQALKNLGENRKTLIFDFFDEADRMSGRGIMSAAEVERRLAFYPQAKVIAGDVRQTMKQLENEDVCFLHFDNQYQPTVIPYVWERMVSGGLILLDNYGHVRSYPAMFDAFLAKHGARVMFIPPLGQGLIIKP